VCVADFKEGVVKEIIGTIQVKKYTDDDGKPVCGNCIVAANSEYRCVFDEKMEIPGPDCPIWKQDDTGAEDDQP
jgi:hypothetical protein